MMLPTTLCREFLHLVIPHCSACPDPVATYMIRRAAISWAETTKGWRYTGSQVLAANNVTLVAPAATEIHTIEEATLDGQPLTPVQFLESDPEQLSGTARLGVPSMITQVSPGSVQIQPFRTGTLRYSVTLKPRSDRLLGTFINDPLRDQYDVVPPILLAQHADTIACGALSMILMLPNQPFSDPTKAMVYRNDFQMRCNSAHVQARPGQQRAPRRTTTHWI
jgi:hypothetical protein